MKRLCVEVEPLSAERWAKIERSLMARLAMVQPQPHAATQPAGRSLRLPVWLAAAFLLGLGGLFFAAPWRADPVEFAQPTRITTGQNTSHLTLPGLVLDVEPESAVVMGSDAADGLLLVLDRGTIVCRVAKRPATAPLIVQAGAARVRVLGTRFAVTRLGESARVKVFEGAVEVTFDGSSTRVAAGEVWSREGLAFHSPNQDVATPELSPRGEDPSVREQASGAISSSSLVGRDDTKLNRGLGSSRSGRMPRTERPDPAREAPRATNGDKTASPPSASDSESLPRRSAQTVFEKATILERTDPSRASQLYAELQSGNDSWAQNALYARGRLEAARGNRDLARRLLERYLERFPRGSNAEDARAVLGRLR